ncbi:hypothetical protein FJ950_08625 [Mesorhizobium sp. B2-3-14]|uniref:hypothetical protein n=1 Tax=unclassified Mesorhizobium TaxID=325217 RepID=UPI001129DEAC|nr:MULTISPECIES: hypothetical protein [unclassified Mesorhizobium]TPK72358.1 hypothetical protein FJ527_25285 [Mesorhizobium sp. B2-4-18]TPL88119.1 hypothetical protein FJ950_08625 [Mesorhizobium sp. B2-3-14]
MSEHPKQLHTFQQNTDRDWTRATDPRLIAALRQLTRSYRAQSAEAADELMVLTLEAAINEADDRPRDITLFRWLSGIMARHLN